MESAEPLDEHRWLQRLCGEWTWESECSMGPGEPPMKVDGRESVRSFGGLFVIAEGRSNLGGAETQTVMTLGYDPRIGRFVGTFMASSMTELWRYEGSLDPARRVLTLDTEGPDFSGDPAGRAKYQDIIELVSDDVKTLRSVVRQPDGTWKDFMTATYRRKS